MKRAPFYLKAAFAVMLVAGLGAGAALVAVKVFFPEPRARAWIVDAARRQLGRDVRLEGIDIGLRGLSLRGLEVSERPDFAAGTFLRVENFRLRPSWRALMHRRLVVAAVAADGLQVRVVKGADGRFNYETLASSTTAAVSAPPSKPGEAPAPEMKVRRALVENGTVEYSDAAGGSWTLTGLNLDVSGFGQAEPFGLKTSFQIRGKAGSRPVDARVDFDGRVDLAGGSRQNFAATVKRLVVEQRGLKLAASGAVASLDTPQIAFDAALTFEGFPALKASGTAKLGDSAAVDVKAEMPGLDAAWLAKLAPQAGIPAVNIPAADIALAGTFSADRADVKSFRATWAGGRIEGAGAARGLKSASPAYDGRVSFGLDVPAIAPGQYPFLKLPSKLALPAGRLDGEASLSRGDLKIESLTAKIKQGTLSAAGTIGRIASAAPVPDVAVALALDLPAFKLSELPFSAPSLPPSFAIPSGRLDGTVRLAGDDVRLDKVAFHAQGSSVRVDGVIAKALAGAARPDLTLTADLTLPALTDKDLPFRGVPAGLRTPPSHWMAEAAYSPRLIRVKSLRLQTGKNDVEVSGTVADPGGRSAYDLIFKCRSFQLEELTRLTPRTRDEKLAGSGFFALSMTGAKGAPAFAGKLQFKGLGATLAGLPLSDFAGTVSFDAQRVDAPNLTGRIADGVLKMNLAVKDYSTAPDVQLEASLDRFDLGRYLEAKNRIVAEREAAQAAKGKASAASAAAQAGKPASAAPEEKPKAVSTRGHLAIGTLIHPNATVTDVKVGWDLRGVAANLRGLSGDAKLQVGGGKLRSVGDMATQSKLVKVLIFPLLVVQKIGSIGGIRLFPDFNNIALDQIVGDYGFQNGVMTLRRAEIDSDAAQVSAKGTIDLVAEALDLVVTTQVGDVAPIDVAVTGTFDKPKSKVDIGKFLAEPAKQLIQGLLNR